MAATITLRDEAPADLERVSLANAVVEVSDLPTETDDAELIANAEGHPFLAVERAPEAIIEDDVLSPHVPREEDALAAPNSVANDPEKVRETEQAKRDAVTPEAAIDAGEDQKKSKKVAKVPVTRKADVENDKDNADNGEND